MFAAAAQLASPPAGAQAPGTSACRHSAIAIQLAGALAAVHAVDVVYRDLHTGNVLITRGESPRAWIFDFDQAQLAPGFYAALTERWATPPEARAEPRREKPLQNMDYAAPEVRAGAAFSAASDVYALGLLLYRLLTGKRPFPVKGGEPTPPRELCPACPHRLGGLLLAMLNPDPNLRPALADVRLALEDDQDEQAELIAELEAEHAGPPATEGARARDTAPTAVATADGAAVTVAAVDEPATATATAARPGASAGHEVAGEPAPARRSGRAFNLWVLGLAVAAGLAIGRATVTRGDVVADGEASMPKGSPMSAVAREHSPAVGEAPSPVGDSPVDDAAAPGSAWDGAATALLPPDATEPKPGQVPPTPRRAAVTVAQATEAAQRAVPELRGCEGVPGTLTADLDIVDGRGVVTALNQQALAPDDPRYPWHACVQRGLERVRFPRREAAGHARVRLSLRQGHAQSPVP